MSKGKPRIPGGWADAKSRGLPHYIGKVCAACGQRKRYTSSGNCVTCNQSAHPKRSAEYRQKISDMWAQKRAARLEAIREARLAQEKHDRKIAKAQRDALNEERQADTTATRLQKLRGMRHADGTPADYGGDNAYPEAYPWNVSQRPPTPSRTFAIAQDRTPW